MAHPSRERGREASCRDPDAPPLFRKRAPWPGRPPAAQRSWPGPSALVPSGKPQQCRTPRAARGTWRKQRGGRVSHGPRKGTAREGDAPHGTPVSPQSGHHLTPSGKLRAPKGDKEKEGHEGGGDVGEGRDGGEGRREQPVLGCRGRVCRNHLLTADMHS